MWQQITEALNPEAQAFLKLWDKAMWLACQPPVNEQAINVLDWLSGVKKEGSPWDWKLNQTRFFRALTNDDLSAYQTILKEGVTA